MQSQLQCIALSMLVFTTKLKGLSIVHAWGVELTEMGGAWPHGAPGPCTMRHPCSHELHSKHLLNPC